MRKGHAGRRSASLRPPKFKALGNGVQTAKQKMSPAWETIRDLSRPVTKRIGLALSTVTPIGRTVFLLGLACWVLAWRFGWTEMAVLAGAATCLLALAALFMIGSTNIAVKMSVEPPRVSVGDPVSGEIEVTNKAKTPLLPVVLELPIGTAGVGFDLPAMLPGSTHSELFVVPTQRRGVVDVGPVTTARGDALGLFRRDVTWSDTHEIFVHPTITALEPLGSGIMRDLEGNTSETISVSDLAFHALREYVPGDDIRHVHWRSSAKHGQLLVRQFLDTRRSHLTAIVDQRLDSYQTEDEYELAISVAGSLLVRAILDGYDATFLSGEHAMTKVTGRAALDACARAVPGQENLISAAGRAARLAPETSIVFLLTGSKADFLAIQKAGAQFPIEVAKIVIRIDSSSRASMRAAGELPLLTLGALNELPTLLKWGI